MILARWTSGYSIKSRLKIEFDSKIVPNLINEF